MLKLNSMNLASPDAKKLAEFYSKVFETTINAEDEGWYGVSAGDVFLGIGGHDKITGPAKEPARIMFNLESADVKAEFERIKALGATVIAEPYSMDEAKTFWIATFADPDGNYFQLMSPWSK